MNPKWQVTRLSNEAFNQINKLKAKFSVPSSAVIDLLLRVYNNVESGTPSESITKESLIPESADPRKQLYQEESLISLKRNPNWIQVDSSQPPNSIIDCCILSLYAPSE